MVYIFLHYVQIDLSIAVEKVASTTFIDVDDDDDDEDIDQKIPSITIGNVQEKFAHERCIFVTRQLIEIEDLEKIRFLSDEFDEFKKELKRTHINNALYDSNTCLL